MRPRRLSKLRHCSRWPMLIKSYLSAIRCSLDRFTRENLRNVTRCSIVWCMQGTLTFRCFKSSSECTITNLRFLIPCSMIIKYQVVTKKTTKTKSYSWEVKSRVSLWIMNSPNRAMELLISTGRSPRWSWKWWKLSDNGILSQNLASFHHTKVRFKGLSKIC